MRKIGRLVNLDNMAYKGIFTPKIRIRPTEGITGEVFAKKLTSCLELAATSIVNNAR